jgi:hypothetical protein
LLNVGGFEIDFCLEKREGIPGLSESDSQEFFAKKKRTEPCICINGSFGQLVNHGLGVAIEVHVWFEAKIIRRSDGDHNLTKDDLARPPYERDWNITPLLPSSLAANSTAAIGKLPTPVFLATPSVKTIEGDYWIECLGSEGTRHVWRQSAAFDFTWNQNMLQQLIVSFGTRLQ